MLITFPFWIILWIITGENFAAIAILGLTEFISTGEV